MKQTPQQKEEEKQIKAAEKLAMELQLLYQKTEVLLKKLGANPFLVKKGINLKCNARTQKNKNTVQFTMNCNISLPAELVK